MHVGCKVDRSAITAVVKGARSIAILLVAIIGCSLNTATAQPYRSDEPDLRAKNFQTSAARFAKDPVTNAVDRPKFDEYLTKWYFPSLTRTDSESLGELPAARDFLFKSILHSTNDPQLQAYVTKLAFDSLKLVIASPPGQPAYHPAVRYNAVLIFGMLDDVYPNQGAAEKPFAMASNALIAIANSATANANFPPPVILGALIGLERHARLAPTPQATDAMSAAVLKLVLRDEPIQGLKGEEFDWLRLRAAAVLAQLGNVGRENQYFNGVLQLVSKFKILDDRCEAAAMLAKFKYEGAKLDGVITSEHLLKLTADVADVELAQALKFEGKSTTGAASVGRQREGGREAASVEIGLSTSPNSYPRRPLVAHLVSLRLALSSTKPALPPETQAKFDAILAAIIPVIDSAANKDTIELVITARVREMSAAIKRLSIVQPPVAANAPDLKG